MKIFVLDPFHPAGLEYAAKHFEVIRWDDPRVKTWHEEADGLMVRMSRVTAADIERARKVKIIGKQGVGYDTVDIAAAKKKGIPVCRTPGVNSDAVAELAVGLALSVSRRVTELDRRIRAGEPVARPDYLAVELFQKTVGIIGVGDIGSRVARIWKNGFGAHVLGYDPYKRDLPCEQVPSIGALLERSDLVTIHVPLNDETHHLMGVREFGAMKKSAIFVNTCRGGVVDEQALYEALKAGRLFGAGLDVWEEAEPPAKSHALLSLPNVVATPHVAGNTFETQARSSMQVATQVVEALQGKPPRPENRVA